MKTPKRIVLGEGIICFHAIMPGFPAFLSLIGDSYIKTFQFKESEEIEGKKIRLEAVIVDEKDNP